MSSWNNNIGISKWSNNTNNNNNSNVNSNQLISSINGLGTIGYISSSQFQSTNNVFIDFFSTIFGSTITGDTNLWSQYPALNNVNINNFNLNNINTTTTSNLNADLISNNIISNASSFTKSVNANFISSGVITSQIINNTLFNGNTILTNSFETNFISSGYLYSYSTNTNILNVNNISVGNLKSDNISSVFAYISSLTSDNISTTNLVVSTINNFSLSSFNTADWANYVAINNVSGYLSNMFLLPPQDPPIPTNIYAPIYSIDNFSNITSGNIYAKQFTSGLVFSNGAFSNLYYGGNITADNFITATYFVGQSGIINLITCSNLNASNNINASNLNASHNINANNNIKGDSFNGSSADIDNITCRTLTAGTTLTNFGQIVVNGVYRPANTNSLYVQGGVTLDGGGTVHGITIGTQPIAGINTMRIDVLPTGIDIVAATYITIDAVATFNAAAGGAASVAAGGALSLAGGSYVEINTANINVISTTYPGRCVLNVDHIFPSQNSRGTMNNFDLYNCSIPGGIIINDLSANNISASNINTSNITASNIIIRDSNNSSNDFNTTYQGIPVLPSQSISSFRIKNAISNIDTFETILPIGIITASNTTLQVIDGVSYNVFDATGTTYYGGILSNTNFAVTVPTLIQFGTTSNVGYCDFYNDNANPLYIAPEYPVGYVGFASLFDNIPSRTYFDSSTSNITFVFLSDIVPLYPSSFVSSLYLQDTSFIQNISSAILQIDLSGYDTNNSKIKGFGILEAKVSSFVTDSIYVNTISAGNIVGGGSSASNWALYPAISNVNIDGYNISNVNYLYTQNLYPTSQPLTIGGDISLFGTNPLYSISNVLKTYTNYLLPSLGINISLSNNNLINGNLISSISSVARIGIFSTIQANTISAGTILGLNSSFTGIINSLGSFGYVSSTQLTSTTRGLGNLGYVSSSQLTSSLIGLGSLKYVSSTQLISTTTGLLNTITSNGSVSNWAKYVANSNVNINGYNIFGVNQLTASLITTPELQVDTLRSYTYGGNIIVDNPFIMNAYIYVDAIQPNTASFVQFPGNGIQTNNITSLDFTQISINNRLFMNSYDISGASAFTFLGLSPIYPSGLIGSNNILVIQNNIDLSNNTIQNVNSITIDSITPNCNAWVVIDPELRVDTINPNQRDYVGFPGNGISTDFLTANSNSYIGFNNDINLLANNIIDVNYIQFQGGTGTSYLSNSVDGYLEIANTNNQIHFQDPLYTDTIFANRTIVSFGSPINMTYVGISNVNNIVVDYLTPNSNRQVAITDGGLSVDYIAPYSNRNVEIDSDLIVTGFLNIDNIKPYNSNSITFISNVNLGNNSISNVNSYTGKSISTINISTNSLISGNLTTIGLSTNQISTSVITASQVYTRNLGNNNPLTLQSIIVNNDFNMGSNSISNATTITALNVSTNNISSGSLFVNSMFGSIGTFNNLTGSNLKTTYITGTGGVNYKSDSIYPQAPYTTRATTLGYQLAGNAGVFTAVNTLTTNTDSINPCSGSATSTILLSGNISTSKLYVSTLNAKQYPFWSTCQNVPPSSFNITGTNAGTPIILYSNVLFPTTGLYNISQKMVSQKLSGGTSADIHGSVTYSRGLYASTTGLYDGVSGIPYTNEVNVSCATTLFTSIYVSTNQTTRNISFLDRSANNYTANIYLDTPVIQYIPSYGLKTDT
jgi:hypothetical protein